MAHKSPEIAEIKDPEVEWYNTRAYELMRAGNLQEIRRLGGLCDRAFMRIKMRLSKRDFVDVNSENIPIGPTANPRWYPFEEFSKSLLASTVLVMGSIFEILQAPDNTYTSLRHSILVDPKGRMVSAISGLFEDTFVLLTCNVPMIYLNSEDLNDQNYRKLEGFDCRMLRFKAKSIYFSEAPITRNLLNLPL